MPAAPRRLRLPVPTHIITGALASGKTTALGGLLRLKPQGEVWAVLVNEFGAAGLDAALLEGSTAAARSEEGAAEAGGDGIEGVHIKQLGGGCLCCALSNVTHLAIAQLLRATKPDRLFIEPSGLAHPMALLDMLQGEHLGSALALQPVVCLVDATQFSGGRAEPSCCAAQLCVDQISVADVLVGSKADLCDDATLAAFHAWAHGLFPPKPLVATAARGQLAAATAEALLARPERTTGSSSASGGGSTAGAVRQVQRGDRGMPWLSSSLAVVEEEPTRERPLRRELQGGTGTHAACGWIFHRDCQFSRPHLLALLQQLVRRTLRLKGVFRLAPKAWVAVSAAPGPSLAAGEAAAGLGATAAAAAAADGAEAGGAAAWSPPGPAPVELVETAYRRDSRMELILDVAAAPAGGAAGPAHDAAGGNPSSGSVEQQVAGLSLAGGATERRVAAALCQAAAGDWSTLEALLMGTLQGCAA